jgi:pyruvate dehydrogenase E1 component alpha subunit
MATQRVPNAPAGDAARLSLYRTMLRLRRLEEKAGMLYALGTLGTPCPLGVGQEGALAGLAEALSPQDAVVVLAPTPGMAVALGDTPRAALENLRPTAEPSASHPMLVRAPQQGLVRVTALSEAPARPAAYGLFVVVGTQSVMEQFRNACAGCEPMVPVLVASRDAVPDVSDLPQGYDVRQVDGVDSLGVAEAVCAARADVLAGRARPLLMILTPPYVGHARKAGDRTVSRRDVPDPLSHCRRELMASGLATETALAALEAAVRDEIADAGRLLAAACDA